MAPINSADTIRVLVSTDNHVGYAERDAERGNDSATTFDEIMQLANDRDVDMILLAGDLFHENKPSRKSMYEVMRSLRLACFGDKPCELQLLSDASEVFQGSFNHANYEDENLNVAIPVFSIHGNHDDPSGEGHYAALDLLQISGLVNYYGRVPQADNIQVRPVLLQKGRTKLALYGLSNVRDERLFRTFRDGGVKFFQPGTQKSEWFNLMSVHQNHHAYTDTGHLPENFLPGFMDLVIWGHEHECLIDPTYNAEMGFHVMQPGSSVATSLSVGEAVPKHVAILSITGKEFKSESIRLKSVRPFAMREIVLQDDKRMQATAKRPDNRPEITRYLEGIVNEMISKAREDWADLQDELPEDEKHWPKPLIRLRVEHTPPDGGRYDLENPQRFSARFQGKVANVTDVVQFHRKKKSGTKNAPSAKAEMPEDEILAEFSNMDSVKVDQLVKEFLAAQTLTILPQNSFGDAVGQYVDKDDNHAVRTFIEDSLESQVKNLLKSSEMGQEDMATAIVDFRDQLEEKFRKSSAKRKPVQRAQDNDSDFEGDWGRPTGNGGGESVILDEDGDEPPKARRGKAASKTTATTRKPAAARKAPAKKAAPRRGKQKAVSEDEEEEEEDDDIVMVDDDEEEEEEDEEDSESQALFVSNKKKPAGRAAAPKSTKRAASPPKKRAPARAKAATASKPAAGKQATLNFSQPQTSSRLARTVATRNVQEISDDEISDDDDSFAPAPSTSRTTRGRH